MQVQDGGFRGLCVLQECTSKRSYSSRNGFLWQTSAEIPPPHGMEQEARHRNFIAICSPRGNRPNIKKKKKIPYTGSEVYHKMLFYILLQRLSGLQIASPHSKRSVVQERLTIFTHTGRWVDGQMWKGLADMMTTVRELLAKLGFM